MNLISISTDRKIFDPASAVAARMRDYSSLVDQLHIIVFTKRGQAPFRLAKNAWVYPTNSPSRFFYVRDGRRLAKKIITVNQFLPSDTIVSTQDPFETGIVGSFVKRHFGVKLQVQIHTDFLSSYFARHSLLNWLRVRIARRVLPQADQIRVVSQRIKGSLEKGYSGIAADKISIVPIFVDPSRFEKPAAFDLHKKYPQFSAIVLMCSRLAPEKNVGFALKVFKTVLADVPTAGLVIVGDGPEKQLLAGLVATLGIQKSVAFELWTSDVVSYYKSADVLLSTSLYEGYGLTLVEAGLAGLPVLTSDVGIAGELLKDGINARICPVNDVSAFVGVLTTLLKSPEARRALGQQARADFLSALRSKSQYLQEYKASLEKTLHD